jgi:hypothetical protein
MEDLDEEETERLPSVPWRWNCLPLRAIEFGANVATDVSSVLSAVAMDLACHMNYQIDQRKFADQARQAIESITAEKD